jgi:Ca2+-binding EF-hand superfamily protein
MDEDKNGTLERKEVCHFLRKVGLGDETLAHRFFDRLDADRSGEVDYTEMQDLLASYIQPARGRIEKLLPGRDESHHAPLRLEPPRHADDMHEARMTNMAFNDMLALVGECARKKYRTCREAFRHLDKDKSGAVDRDELTGFLRSNGFPDMAKADAFFNYVDTDGSGAISNQELTNLFAPYIQPSRSKADSQLPGKHPCLTDRHPHVIPNKDFLQTGSYDSGRWAVDGRRGLESEAPPLSDKEYNKMVNEIGLSAAKKHTSVRKAFCEMDEDKNGYITSDEVAKFLRGFGYPNQACSDRFFNYLDRNNSGSIDYDEFVGVFAPYIQPAKGAGESILPGKHSPSPALHVSKGFHDPFSLESLPTARAPPIKAAPNHMVAKEIKHIVASINGKAEEKLGSIRKALRTVEKDSAGNVSRDGMKKFLRNYGVQDNATSDKFFNSLDSDGNGFLNSRELDRIFNE